MKLQFTRAPNDWSTSIINIDIETGEVLNIPENKIKLLFDLIEKNNHQNGKRVIS